MKYISTRNTRKEYNFEEVFIKGLAEDGGLFVPKFLNKYNEEELKTLSALSYQDLAKKIIFPFIAFKDIAMQLLGNFYEYYLKKKNNNINVIVATSGDTGAAAINSIKGKNNMNIFILHPHNKVSVVQRKLMSTVKEKNVFNIAIYGNFDDCQNLVKSMFADKEFSTLINMSGVNSINWARIIAQSVYYFYCYFLIKDKSSSLTLLICFLLRKECEIASSFTWVLCIGELQKVHL